MTCTILRRERTSRHPSRHLVVWALGALAVLGGGLPAMAGEPGFNEFPIEMQVDSRPQADGAWIVQVNHRDRMDKPGTKPTPARIRAYVPPGPEPIKLVLFDLGYTYTCDRTDLQAIARAERWCLVSCLLRYKRGTELYDAAMGEIAKATRHPELEHALVVPFGFSRNGARAWTFLAENKDRTVALSLGGNPGMGGMSKTDPDQAALAKVTPVLTVVGSHDPFVDYDKGPTRWWHVAVYPKIRAQDLPWGMMIEWGGGHGWGRSWSMFVAFVQEAYRLRVTGPGAPLKPLPFEQGWLVESGWTRPWPQAAPVKDYAGDTAATVWLPSEALVVPWRGYNTEKPQVTIALAGGALRAEAPEGTTAVEFYDRATLLGTAKAAPWTIPAKDLSGVRTLVAAAVLGDGGRTASRPLTAVDGEPLDWAVGDADQKAADSPQQQIRLPAELRAALNDQLAGKAPPPAQLQALKAALTEAKGSPHIEQREAAEKLLGQMP